MGTALAPRKPGLTATDRAIIAARARMATTEAEIRMIATDYEIPPVSVRDIALGDAMDQLRGRAQAVLEQLQLDEEIQRRLLECTAAVEELRANQVTTRVPFVVSNLRHAVEQALVRAADLGRRVRDLDEGRLP